VKTMWNPHQRAEICKRKRQELQGELTEVRLKKMQEEEDHFSQHSSKANR